MGAMRHKLPGRAVLPASPVTENAVMLAAVGNPSRQVIREWRVSRGFPKSFRDGESTFVLTADLSQWLQNNGVTVERESEGEA